MWVKDAEILYWTTLLYFAEICFYTLPFNACLYMNRELTYGICTRCDMQMCILLDLPFHMLSAVGNCRESQWALQSADFCVLLVSSCSN